MLDPYSPLGPSLKLVLELIKFTLTPGPLHFLFTGYGTLFLEMFL